MKFEHVVNYSWYRPTSEVREDLSKPLVDEIPDNSELVVDSNPRKAILEAIYAVDPVSRFPSGDIAAYVSDKTSPEVKNWILSNIMLDTSSVRNVAAPDGVSDDVIESLMRRDGESSLDYAQRVSDYYQSEVDNINQVLEYARQRSEQNERSDVRDV